MPELRRFFLLIFFCFLSLGFTDSSLVTQLYFESLNKGLILEIQTLKLASQQISVLQATGGFISRADAGYEALTNRLFLDAKQFSKPPAKPYLLDFNQQLSTEIVLSKSIENQAKTLSLFAHAYFDTILEESEQMGGNSEQILENLDRIFYFLESQKIEFARSDLDLVYTAICHKLFLETMLDWSDLLYYQGIDPRTMKVDEIRAGKMFMKISSKVDSTSRSRFIEELYPESLKKNWTRKLADRINDVSIQIESGWFQKSVKTFRMKDWISKGMPQTYLSSLIEQISKDFRIPNSLKHHHQQLQDKLASTLDSLARVRKDFEEGTHPFSVSEENALEIHDSKPKFEKLEEQ